MRRVPTYYQDLFDIIGSNPGHVIGMTACLGGALGTQLLKYRASRNEQLLIKIKQWCGQLNKLFGNNNFYLEMQPSSNPEQIYVNQWIVRLSEELGIPFTITNDAHYLKKEDLKIEKIFLNSQGGEREVESFYATTYLMNDTEIHEYMENSIGSENIHKAYGSIESILSRATDYSLKKDLRIPSLPWRNFGEYPQALIDSYIDKMPMLQNFIESEYKSDNTLAIAVIDGIQRHVDLQNAVAYDELNKCLQDTWISSQVNKAQWSAYFLNLQKLIDVCWDAGTLVGCGRGSGVGFLLLYCLDITQINPLRESTKTFRFRFLNPERVSVLDIDTDITGLNRGKVLDYIRNYYGQDRVANVLTLRTEKSKSAILAAARGLGVDVDIAQYIASLVPAERGQLWSLHDCMYGNDDDRAPVKQFVYEMTENYPEIWEVISQTEGLIVGMGEHAGGLVLIDEPFTNSTALMRAPNGDVMTQFELHTAERASLIKLDLLSVEAIDKMQICLELLREYGYIDKTLSLRAAYEQTIGVYQIDRNIEDMWHMVWDHKINSLFQLEQQSGITGIAALHPTSVDDLAVLNSAIRLMAQEKGGEMPVNKLARFKSHPADWDREIEEHYLNVAETKKLLNPILNTSYGLCIAQEQFMQLVQMPELGGMTLTDADALRKSIAKKNPAAYDKWIEKYRQVCQEKGIDEKLVNYVIELIGMSKGYGFRIN